MSTSVNSPGGIFTTVVYILLENAFQKHNKLAAVI